MAIEFTCDCGAACSADECRAGQLFHCDACGLDILVPSPRDATETDSPADEAPSPDAAGAVHAAIEDIGDAEAERAMVEQMKEVAGDPDAIAAQHREALDALRLETAGDAGTESLKAKRDGHIQALHDQLGAQGGIAEMAEQMREVRDGEGGEGIALAAGELGPRTARPVKKGPPRGKQRAAHHIGFKKVIWLPSLLVGLVCVVFGVLACAGISPNTLLKGSEENPYKQHVAYFEEQVKKAGIGEFEIVEAANGSWAIPKGATHSVSQSGIVYFQNVPAYGKMAPDEPAVDATDYVKAANYSSGRGYGYAKYAIALLAVGAILIVLSLITLRDVRIVAAMRTEQTPGEQEEGAEAERAEAPDGEVVPAEAGETGEDSTNPSPGEPSDDATPPDEDGPPDEEAS